MIYEASESSGQKVIVFMELEAAYSLYRMSLAAYSLYRMSLAAYSLYRMSLLSCHRA
jgi:hypothetical protein